MRITIIGSGNVATHMTAAFKNAGHRIVQVYSATYQHAAMLAYHVGAEPADSLDQLYPETDIFIISIKDDAIIRVAEQLARYEKLTVHTSGATSLEALAAVMPQVGIFYPLQTFSKHKEVDFRAVPLCIEGNNEDITHQLLDLARTISNNVSLVNSDQRRILHLAAVFACNFPNYLYQIAADLLKANQLEFGLLRPLILETADKIRNNLPSSVQTGPATRNDQQTMEAHLALLQGNVFLQNVYRLLSDGIMKMDKN